MRPGLQLEGEAKMSLERFRMKHVVTGRRAPGRVRGIAVRILLMLAVATAAMAGEAAAPPTDSRRPKKDSAATLQLELAHKLREEKLYSTAIPQFEKFIALHSKDPRYPEALFWLADCHLLLQQYDHAARYYQEFIRNYKKHKRYALALLNLGRCRLKLKSYDRAMAALLELEKLPPPAKLAGHTKFYLGQAYYRKADYVDALQCFDVVVADTEADARYRSLSLFWAADVHQRTNKFEKAVKCYLRHLKEFPGRGLAGDIQMRLGECYQRLGQYSKAAERFALAEKHPRFLVDALHNRTMSLFKTKKYAAAIQPAQQLIAKFPDSEHVGNAYLLLGRCNYELKQYAEAVKSFEKLVLRFPNAPAAEEALLRSCWCYYYLGEKHHPARMKACQSYLAKYAKSKESGEVRFLLGDVSAALGQLESAVADFKAVTEASPYYERSRLRIALTYHQLRNLPEAAAAYDDFVAGFPRNKRVDYALMQAGLIYYYLAESAEAAEKKKALYAKVEDRLEKFLKNYPTHKSAPEMLFIRGQSERLQGKIDEMAATFGQYVQIDGVAKVSSAMFWIGEFHRSKGDRARLAADAKIDQKMVPEARKLLAESVSHDDLAISAYRKSIKLAGKPANTPRARRGLAQASFAAGVARLTETGYLRGDAKNAAGQEKAERLEKLAEATAAKAGKQLDDAAAAYERVFNAAPELVTDPNTYRWAASRFRTRKEPARAIRIYKALLERWPKTETRHSVLSQLAITHTELPRPDWRASLSYNNLLLDEYAQQAKTNPAKPRKFETQAKFGKALALKQLDQYDAAAELFNEVIERRPVADELSVRSRVELGEVYFRQAEKLETAGNKRAAAKKHAQAINLFAMVGMLYEHPELPPRSLYWSGRCIAARKNLPEAVRLWHRLIEQYPESPWAGKARTELKRLGVVVENGRKAAPK